MRGKPPARTAAGTRLAGAPRCLAVLACLTLTVPPAAAQTSGVDETITVTGRRREMTATMPFAPTRVMTSAAVDAMAEDSVSDLLQHFCRRKSAGQARLVILIDGKYDRGQTIDYLGELPTEVIERIEVLPREAAARYGVTNACAVINVVLKKNVSILRAGLSYTAPDRGHTDDRSAFGSAVNLKKKFRISGHGRFSMSSPLFASERDVRLAPAEEDGYFAAPGNVLAGSGNPADEIDPMLSALAGKPARVVGLPPGQDGTGLSQEGLVPFVNRPNLQDDRAFRMLRSRTARGAATASITGNPTEKLRYRISADYNRSRTESLNGFAQSALSVPPSNAFTPFGTDVTVNYLFEEADPLHTTRTAEEARIEPRLRWGTDDWEVSLSQTYVYSRSHGVRPGRPDRDVLAGRLADPDPATAFNPFGDGSTNGPDLLGAIFGAPVDTRRTSYAASADLGVDASVFKLPAGPLAPSLSFDYDYGRNRTETTEPRVPALTRTEDLTYGVSSSLTVPLLGRKFSLPGVASLSASASAHAFRQSGSDVALDHRFGVSWSPFDGIRAGMNMYRSNRLPGREDLAGALMIQENVPYYDPVNQETVFVRVVTGGNPDLRPAFSRATSYTLSVSPGFLSGLELEANYRDSRSEDQISPLPPFDANTERLYPGRVRRDPSGRLVEIDIRPLNQAQARTADLEVRFWYQYWNEDDPGASIAAAIDGTYTRKIRNEVTATPGAPVQDLLEGKTGLTETRDEAEAYAMLGYRGLQLVATVSYSGPHREGGTERPGGTSTPDIFFPALTVLSLDLGYRFGRKRLFDTPELLDGLRIRLGVTNLLDTRRKVVDETGRTPARYQPDLLDPMGRVLTASAFWQF